MNISLFKAFSFYLTFFTGHWEVVRLLLDHTSDIEHRNKAGCTPLMLAARLVNLC